MEERLPSMSDDAAVSMLPLPLPPGRAHETYVVQIPRENICRVPPPHHASIVEEHTRLAAIKKELRRKRLHVPYALPILMIAVVVAGMAMLTVRATVYSPTPPAFTVTRFQYSNDTRSSPEFKIAVHSKNRNPRMSISYHGGRVATLVFKNRIIGQGKIPATIKGGASGAADFAVALAGKGASLSTETKKKLDDGREKLVELTLVLPVEMKSWLRNEKMNVKIYCDIWVRNSLMKKAKITFQDCLTVS